MMSQTVHEKCLVQITSPLLFRTIIIITKYLKVIRKTGKAKVHEMKQIFPCHDIPITVVDDNMPRNSKTFKQFVKE